MQPARCPLQSVTPPPLSALLEALVLHTHMSLAPPQEQTPCSSADTRHRWWVYTDAPSCLPVQAAADTCAACCHTSAAVKPLLLAVSCHTSAACCHTSAACCERSAACWRYASAHLLPLHTCCLYLSTHLLPLNTTCLYCRLAYTYFTTPLLGTHIDLH